ncbi:MAG: TonB-dependent receptor domain-containing protein, partial [Acidobacteriota bacterium]
GYTNFTQTLGNAEITYNSAFYNFFAQDDWKVTRRLKLNYGLRYDLYDVPEGDVNSPFEQGRNFRVDKNNFAPRLGFVYSLNEGSRPTVIRGSFGMYYDTVYLVMYENAIQGNGTGRYLNVTRTPAQPGAPDFPNIINASLSSLGITQNAEVVSPDFKNMYALHYQAQLEQALTNDLSVTLGYIHSNGRMIPVYRQINCRPVGTSLADGRPLYGTVAINATSGAATVTPCTNKVNPAFNNVIQVESGGTSNYDALTLQFNKRFSQGYQFSVNYTLSKARDNAPERNLQGVGAVTQSDPSNREFDRGYGVADQRHTLSATFVARPKFNIESRSLAYLLNNNQLSFIATAGSGETFPITTNFDLNADGILNDIPVGYERNAGRSPAGVNVDFRYSRVIPLNERFKLEVMAEALNIFNINSTVTFTNTAFTANNINTSVVDPRTGAVVRALTPFIPTGQESRQGQVGIKLIF